MKPRAVRSVGLIAGLAVTAGLAAALPSVAAAGGPAQDVPAPRFERVIPGALPGGSAEAARTAAGRSAPVSAKVRRSSGEQILQAFKGAQAVGGNGLDVAAGPGHVVQVGGPAARIFSKATAKVRNKTTNRLFGIDAAVTLTEPTVSYDPLGRRWIIAAVADDAGDVSVAVRVSKKTAPTKWFPAKRYGTTAGDGANIVESQPQIGTSSDKAAVTAVADDPTDPTSVNRILILPKTGSQGLYADGEADVWSALVNSTYDGQRPAMNSTKQGNLFIAIPDTNDVTVTTYTGAATADPPLQRERHLPGGRPPAATHGAAGRRGDTLDLGPLAFTGVAWRKGKLWAVTTVNSAGYAAVRVFGVNTAAGVALVADETLGSTDVDWVSPSLAIDGSGTVHLVAQDVGSAVGPSVAVFARKGAGSWTAPRFVAAGTAPANPTDAATEDWADSTAAASDPTSPWDVWVTGTAGDSLVPIGLTSRVARVSLAKNVAAVKASRASVAKGGRVTFTVKLKRPDSKDVVMGLPVALQSRPLSGGAWKTLKSAKTSAKGVAKWTVTVRKSAQYRTLGKVVKQSGTPPQGRAVDKVTSTAVKVRVT